MINIAIIASGSGSNAENIIKYFQNSSQVNVKAVYCNNPKAFIFQRLVKYGIEVQLITKEGFYENSTFIDSLGQNKIDFIILAGFLWLIPTQLINAYPNKIINIHPALLPKYGGKGMYGNHVHAAVLNNRELETGITIHLVNENYDEGEILFQAKCSIIPEDSLEKIAEKVHNLEYEHFPRIIEQVVLKTI